MDMLKLLLPCLLPLALLAACSVSDAQDIPAPTERDREILSRLSAGHPRIYASEMTFVRARRFVTGDPLGQRWLENLKGEAGKMLSQEPVQHVLVGPRLLSQSRAALNRITTLAMAFRLTGERPFAERAVKEMLTAAAFEDWNPSHFLDTAEMTHALAVGYDWLYDEISPADRGTIATAIVDLGLKPSLPLYQKQSGWVMAIHNWNQVCNGGMTVGALAVADREPELAAYIVGRALESVPRAMNSYAPDGGWPEGPSYWHYATRYNVYFIAALESALGSDFGMCMAPGFAETGRFQVHITGPIGRTFNYADGGDSSGRVPELFWLSRKFDDPLLAWEERRRAGDFGTPFDILWYEAAGDSPSNDNTPLDSVFHGVNVAFLRGAWDDPEATYVGFKGGNNRANHSHLDLGTFVLDALGKRWAVDLGPDDYNLPGYWRPEQRFGYFRLSTLSHNTLTFEGKNQALAAKAPITAFASTPERAFAIADISEAYAEWTTSVRRGIALLDRKAVLVQDEIEAAEPVSPVWSMLTLADVRIEGPRKAVLTMDGKTLTAEILAPSNASFRVESGEQEPPQRDNKGASVLRAALDAPSAATTIAVLLTPRGHSARRPNLTPLRDWGD